MLRNLDSVFGHSAELNPTEYDAVERADSYSYLNTNPGMVLKSWFGLDETQFQYCGENKYPQEKRNYRTTRPRTK